MIFPVRLGSKNENRLSLNLNNDSGFSSLPPSTSTSSPTSSSTTSPPESSSNHDSDSDQDKISKQERRSKIVGRVKTKRIVNTPGWINKMSPPEAGICEKCETGEVARSQLQAEVDRLKSELGSTRQTIVRLHDREEKMKERWETWF